MKKLFAMLAITVVVLVGLEAATVYWRPKSHEAEASTRRAKWLAAAMNSGASAFQVGQATFARSWDWYMTGDQIDALQDAGVISAWPVQSDAGTLLAGHTDSGMVLGYQSSAGFSAVGLGTNLVGHGQSFQGGWWQRTSGVTLPGFTGPGFKQLIRVVFTHEAGASAVSGILLQAGRSGVGAITLRAASLTQFQCTLQNAEGAYTALVTAPQGISTGAHILDVFISDSENAGVNERANSSFWLDGVYIGAAEHTADQPTPYTSGQINQLAVGAGQTGTVPVLGRTVFFAGVATNATSSWFDGYQVHYRDCVALGLCPDMGGGASRGTGRGLLPGYDAGINNIVQPSGFIADGRTRTGWGIYVPSSYNPSVPTNVYVHFCGCSWTGTSCRGSFVAGSLATADPQLEAPDPNGINVYADSQYTDPTDCSTAGGGNGWVRGNSALSDYQLRYTDALVAYIRQNFAVRAMWCAGRSNGGAWCEFLAAMRPDYFSGVQSAIGYLPGNLNGGQGMTSTQAYGRTPVYMSHNRDDPTVPVNYARLSVPFWLQRNLGLDASASNPAIGDGGFGWCISTDGGVANDGSLLGSCGCGATTSPYDSGPAGSICCTWPTSVADLAALDGGAPKAVRYCEGTGGHVPPVGEGYNSYYFFQSLGEDAGG